MEHKLYAPKMIQNTFGIAETMRSGRWANQVTRYDDFNVGFASDNFCSHSLSYRHSEENTKYTHIVIHKYTNTYIQFTLALSFSYLWLDSFAIAKTKSTFAMSIVYMPSSQKHNQHKRSEIFQIAFLLHNASNTEKKKKKKNTIYMTRCDLFRWKFCCEVIINATSKTTAYIELLPFEYCITLHYIASALLCNASTYTFRFGSSSSYRFLVEI